MSTPEPLWHKNPVRIAASRRSDIHGWACWIGIVLLMAFLAQVFLGIHWSWLYHWQQNDFYKQLSGIILVTYLAHQWHLAVLRAKGRNRQAGRELTRHRIAGTIAPLVLYLHSQSFGHGFQIGLVAAFLALTATGLLHPVLARSRISRWQGPWLLIHIVLAVVLMALLSFHVYVSYAYR